MEVSERKDTGVLERSKAYPKEPEVSEIKRSRAEGRARGHLDSEDLGKRASKYSRNKCLEWVEWGTLTNLGDNSLFGLVVSVC